MADLGAVAPAPVLGRRHLPYFGVGGTIGWAVGIGFGSVFLTWLYDSADRSILVVALWHTAYNFATATKASSGAAAAIATSAVIIASVVILRRSSTWTSPAVEVVKVNQ